MKNKKCKSRVTITPPHPSAVAHCKRKLNHKGLHKDSSVWIVEVGGKWLMDSCRVVWR